MFPRARRSFDDEGHRRKLFFSRQLLSFGFQAGTSAPDAMGAFFV
jgi:hypothetical protein